MAAQAPAPFRHLSPSIAPKQHFLTVDLTVKLARHYTKSPVFKCLRVLETIEWEVMQPGSMSNRNIDELLAVLKQAGNSMNDQCTQLESINASGYPLQIAIANAVKASSGSHCWHVLYEEHAWRHDNRQGFINLVLEHESLQVVLLIECKRLSDTKWEAATRGIDANRYQLSSIGRA